MEFNLIDVFAWLVIGLLSVFTLRRLLVLIAAVLPRRKFESGSVLSVAVIVSVYNEAKNLPGLLDSLDALEYPQERISFTLVDDGSSDSTPDIVRNWANSRSNARYLVINQNIGKPAALNQALGATPDSELIAIYDADLRPHPKSLGILTGAFNDGKVAAAGGFRQPDFGDSGLVAAYTTLEYLVHQLVTQAGKDRLGLNPTTLGGNCVYRRSALSQVGGFPSGAFSEDIEVSLALVKAGWRIRFCVDAVAHNRVVHSLRRYWNQRCRWTQGLYHSRKHASGLEGLLLSFGYLDRLTLLAALVLAAGHHISWLWPAIYFLGPAFTIAAALFRANLSRMLSARIILSIPPMLPIDIAVTIAGTINTLLGRRQSWDTDGSSG